MVHHALFSMSRRYQKKYIDRSDARYLFKRACVRGLLAYHISDARDTRPCGCAEWPRRRTHHYRPDWFVLFGCGRVYPDTDTQSYQRAATSSSHKMNPLLLVLLLVATVHAEAINALDWPNLTKETPIFIELNRDEPESVALCGKQKSAEDARKLLEETASKFGPHDPVIIICESDISISTLLHWYHLTTKTHPRTWMVVRSQNEGDRFSLLATSTITDTDVLAYLKFLLNRQKQGNPTKIIFPTFESIPNLPTGPPSQYKGANDAAPASDEFIKEINEAIKRNK